VLAAGDAGGSRAGGLHALGFDPNLAQTTQHNKEKQVMSWIKTLASHKILSLSVLFVCLGFSLVLPANTFESDLQDFPDPTGAVRTGQHDWLH